MNIRNSMIALIAGINAVNAEMQELALKRGGAYTGMVALAADLNDAAKFELETEALFSDIRANVEQLGSKTGCKLGKPNKDGVAAYTIPSGISTAKSVILSAFEHGVELKNGDEVKAFTAIRDEAKAAREEAEFKLLSEEDQNVIETQARITAKLDGIKAMAAKIEVAGILAILEVAVEQLQQDARGCIDSQAETLKLETAQAQADSEADAVAALMSDSADSELDDSLESEPEVQNENFLLDSFSQNALDALMDCTGMTAEYVAYIVGDKPAYNVTHVKAAHAEFVAEMAQTAS